MIRECYGHGCDNEFDDEFEGVSCSNDSNCTAIFCASCQDVDLYRCENCRKLFCENCIQTEPISGADICSDECARQWWHITVLQAANKVVLTGSTEDLKELNKLRRQHQEFLHQQDKKKLDRAKTDALKKLRIA